MVRAINVFMILVHVQNNTLKNGKLHPNSALEYTALIEFHN